MFHIAVRDHQLVAVHRYGIGAFGQQLLAQARIKLPQRKSQIAKLLRIDQPACAIVTKHQPIFFFHLPAHRIFWPAETVAYQLEHHRQIARGEHHHHHAALAVGMHQLLLRMDRQMRKHTAVALGLALLGTTQHAVQLFQRLVRQQRTHERHHRAYVVDVGMEIAARIAEQNRHLLPRDKQRIHPHTAVGMHQGDHQRMPTMTATQAPDQIRASLAIEHRLQHVDRFDRRQTRFVQARG